MKQLTVKDVRNTLYQMMIPEVRNIAEENLSSADFWFDLGMDEQDVIRLMTNLGRGYHVLLTTNVLDSVRIKNTVGTLIHAANNHLVDLDEK